jgi:hypothetical protein
MKALLYAVLVIVAVVAAVIAAGLMWLGALWAGETFKLGWLEVPVHYRLTFGVEVGGITYTGSTVVQVTYRRIPSWQVIIGPGIASLYEGQAGYIKLPDGKAIFLLPQMKTPMFPGKRRYDAAGIANFLLSVNGSPSGPSKKWAPIGAGNATTVAGSSDIPDNFLPPMIILDNAADISTAHFFHPEHPEQTLGDQSRFLGAQIAVTSDPVSQGIETEFPWLESGHSILGDPGDPFQQENGGFGLYQGDFVWEHLDTN